MQVSLKTLTKNKNIAEVECCTTRTTINNVKIEIRHGSTIFVNEQRFDGGDDIDDSGGSNTLIQKESVINYSPGAGKHISVKTVYKEMDQKIIFEVESGRPIQSVTVYTPTTDNQEELVSVLDGDSMIWLRRGMRIRVRTVTGNALILDYIFGF